MRSFLLQVVSDLLTLAGIRGNPEQRPSSRRITGADISSAVRGASECQEEMNGHKDIQVRRRPVKGKIVSGCNGELGSSCGGKENRTHGKGEKRPPGHENTAVEPPLEGGTLRTSCRLGRGSSAERRGTGQREGTRARSGADGIKINATLGDEAVRPTTKSSDRGRSTRRANGRPRRMSGSEDRVPKPGPPWKGSFREGDGGTPSAEEVGPTST